MIRRGGEVPLYDDFGSVRAHTNSSQSVTHSQSHEAFGQSLATSGSTSDPYGFGGFWGYRSDGDAGFTLVGARLYDAQAGRFITPDSLLTEHPYLYCGADPVNHVDPSGHRWWQWFIQVCTFITNNGALEGQSQLEMALPALQAGNARMIGGSGGGPPSRFPIQWEGGETTPPRRWQWGGGRSSGSGGGIAAPITIGVGAGVGADLVRQGVHWRRGIESYLDPDGEFPSNPGGF